MAWKKGAVVIVKRGDEDWADAIVEKGLKIQKVSDKEIEELRNENEKLKCANEMTKIHDTRFTNAVIQNLSIENDYYPTRPKWLRIIMEGFALIVYWISLFADKYLVIK